ncbi:MAG: hypothetical protein JWO94_2302 [Verrucomicrobiaceae bacterium]|nr:hypothetical protein [Verrucomicrobiaceae bacterium]
MSPFYSHPAVRQRLIEFLGGETLDRATAVYITHSDGCGFKKTDLRPPVEIDWFFERDLDVARSLADSASLLLHLDVEYVNFDSPVEAFIDPWRTFDLQEPVVKVIESLLLEWGIRPLHIITGQGHHFVWRISRASAVARRITELSPAPERVDACQERMPALLKGRIDRESQSAFTGLSLISQFIAHRTKELAAPLCELPVEITAVHVGPGASCRREIISIDISEYGDPLQTRMIRAPFTKYLKPWVTGLAHRLGVADQIPVFPAIPLHEMDIRQALVTRQIKPEVCELARRACVRIPDEPEGTQHLVDSYLASRLRRFHEYFYSSQHDPRERWSETYARTPLETFPHCIQHILQWPNDLLLKPAGIQLVTRSLLAAGWHPRHIAGLIRSKFEDPSFNWGVDWNDYEAGTRADFYTSIFAGLHATGLDKFVDFNCTSTQEKGFCFAKTTGCAGGLDFARETLLAQQPP